MTVDIPDLWPAELKPTTQVVPPVVILRRQATALADRTHGLLTGRVTSSRRTPQSGNPSHDFSYDLQLIAPVLEYSHRILTVEHDVSIYPAFVTPRNSTVPVPVNSEGELLAELKRILASRETTDLIGLLLAQSESAD